MPDRNNGRNSTLKRKFQSVQKQEPETNYISQISYELETCFSFDEQVASLIEQTKETNEERQKIEQVLEDVKEVFNTIIPGVQTALFGSRLTGLAFKGTDLDILLLCRKYHKSSYL
jgi:DNA polymerase sigma